MHHPAVEAGIRAEVGICRQAEASTSLDASDSLLVEAVSTSPLAASTATRWEVDRGKSCAEFSIASHWSLASHREADWDLRRAVVPSSLLWPALHLVQSADWLHSRLERRFCKHISTCCNSTDCPRHSASTPFHYDNRNYYWGQEYYQQRSGQIMCSMPLEQLIQSTAQTTVHPPTAEGVTGAPVGTATPSPDQLLSQVSWRMLVVALLSHLLRWCSRTAPVRNRSSGAADRERRSAAVPSAARRRKVLTPAVVAVDRISPESSSGKHLEFSLASFTVTLA